MSYDATERARLKTNYARVEALMLDFCWHDSTELMRIGGMRAVGRLHELKAQGYDYEKQVKPGCKGVWRYRLIARAVPSLFGFSREFSADQRATEPARANDEGR